ncbi:MAG: PIN domain-containing protein [Thermoplasmata archaeon]
MVSLDSSFLIDLLAGETRAVLKARELDQSGEPRYLTAPAASEVLIGAYRLGAAYLTRTVSLIDSLPLLPFDRASCHEAGRLGSELSARGTPLGQADLFIAAITRRHGERLLTKDRSFVQVPGLTIESY